LRGGEPRRGGGAKFFKAWLGGGEVKAELSATGWLRGGCWLRAWKARPRLFDGPGVGAEGGGGEARFVGEVGFGVAGPGVADGKGGLDFRT